ncbi:MAG: hypothetical protein M1834_005631 [Cirrosporium novae-zelandiae]|nr:MAG: hypothetical protein M1834_005631 [Cirrosporium novae-zelandiae]
MWPGKEPLLISIGTGLAPGKSFHGNIKKVVEAMKGTVTQTEQTNNEFRGTYKKMAEDRLLFRFNVNVGMASVGLKEHKYRDLIATSTQTYLNQEEVSEKRTLCVNKLLEVTSASGSEVNEPISKSKAVSTVPFQQDRYFIGREDILHELRTILDVQNNHVRAALVGLGGISKSQIAIEYSYKVREKFPETQVFWIYASNAARFKNSYRNIATTVKILGQDDKSLASCSLYAIGSATTKMAPGS